MSCTSFYLYDKEVFHQLMLFKKILIILFHSYVIWQFTYFFLQVNLHKVPTGIQSMVLLDDPRVGKVTIRPNPLSGKVIQLPF